MKTKKLHITFVIALFMLFAGRISAQAPLCNYQIDNSGSCHIDVTVQFFDSNGACGTAIPLTNIGTGLTPVSCSCGHQVVNVVVTLLAIDSNTVTGSPAVDNANTHEDGTNTATSCASGNYTMDWFYNRTVIGY